MEIFAFLFLTAVVKWDKAACLFCGIGCSVMVATKDNRVIAPHGDIRSEVNRGLNCVKGHFLPKIIYGPFTGEKTCIDCHKGIAHHLPDMRGVPGWQ